MKRLKEMTTTKDECVECGFPADEECVYCSETICDDCEEMHYEYAHPELSSPADNSSSFKFSFKKKV